MRAPTPREALALLRATDPRLYVPPIPHDITPAALQARQRFALDAEMAQADLLFPQESEKGMAAGLHLIEAKARIAAGEYGDKFALFPQFACKGLAETRALRPGNPKDGE